MTDLPASGDVLGTPAPVLSPDRVTALVGAGWRLPAGTVRPLTSERDVNVLVDGRYVLKVSNPAEDPAVIDMENTAMAHAARIDPGLPLPSVVRTASGASVVGIADDAGEACLARLVTVVPGSPAEGRPVTTGLAGQIGALAARTSLALQGLFHRAGDRVLDWDIRRAHQVLSGPGVLDGLGELGPVLAGLLPRLARAADATAALPAGDGTLRRAGRSTGLGVEFDIYWLAPPDMERQVTDAGFTTTFWGGRAAEGEEGSPQGYLIAQRS